MIYTVCLDISIDDDEIIEDEVIAEHLKDTLSSSSINISNVRVLDVND